MSTPIDPKPKFGDGPNRNEPAESRASRAGEEHSLDEERGEGGNNGLGGGRGEGGGNEGHGREGGDAPKTASKGINPVQHSE
jgi:hypothetical protein